MRVIDNCLIILTVFLIIFLRINGLAWFPVCPESKKATKNKIEDVEAMFDCCEIYSLTYTPEQRHNCSMQCLQDDPTECCYDACFAKTLNLYDFERNAILYDNFVQATTMNFTLDDQLIKIATDSVKTCKNSVKKMVTGTERITPVCDMIFEIYVFSKCVLRTNYANCPNVTEYDECKSMEKFSNCSENFKKVLATYTKQPET